MFFFVSLFFNLYMYNNLGKILKIENIEYICIFLNKDNKNFIICSLCILLNGI